MEVFFRTQNQFHITNEKIIMVYAQSPREEKGEGGGRALPSNFDLPRGKNLYMCNFSNLYVGPQTL